MDADAALAAYNEYAAQHGDLFKNSPGTAFEIVFDPDIQRRLGAGIVYRDDYYLLLRDAVQFRDGSVGSYIRLIHAAGSGGAAVLPLVDGKLVLIHHQRHATRSSHWEVPRGFGRPGEDPLETARREVAEELGVTNPDLRKLGSVHSDTGASNGHTMLYLALIDKVGQLESDEGIDGVCQVTPEDFDSMLRAGEITDSFTLAAVLQARVRGLFR
ncbi:MAG: NUDIX hydrolase [Streptosporangiaceae bacterium]